MIDSESFEANDLPPPRHELEQIDEYSQYLLHSRVEILAVLRTLIQKNALLTVYFDRGRAFFLTSMLALLPETGSFVFDIGSDKEINANALRADKLIFTTIVDKIKIQFSSNAPSPINHDGHPAFASQLPETLLRLQRREFFRMATPAATPIRLHSSLPRPGGAVILDVPLLDISGGGVGLMLVPDQARLLIPGDLIENCRITLPEEGLLSIALGVHNLFDVTTRGGARYVRVGCEYVDLPAARLTAIQRYITRTERERKARLNGLGSG